MVPLGQIQLLVPGFFTSLWPDEHRASRQEDSSDGHQDGLLC